jgi:hypothetical protein
MVGNVELMPFHGNGNVWSAAQSELELLCGVLLAHPRQAQTTRLPGLVLLQASLRTWHL